MAWIKCFNCGVEINDNQETCEACGSVQPKRSSGATLLQRFAGRLIDILIVGAITGPITFFRMGGPQGLQSMMQSMTRGQSFGISFIIESFFVGTLVFLVLNGYLLLRKGQTIGKLAMKTKIVDMDGTLPGFGKIFVLRYLLPNAIGTLPLVGLLFSLVDACVIFGKDHRCLHDYIAGTQVIST